jgi:hypothetical protein
MKIIKKILHTCSNCVTSFQAFSLGDFSYGEFLLWSKSGNCRYLNAFEDPTYQEVIDIIQLCKETGAVHVHDASQLLQEVYGELACDVDEFGEPYRMNYPSCPNCGSTNIALVGSEIVGQAVVSNVTHEIWNSFTQKEKEARLLKIVGNIHKWR